MLFAVLEGEEVTQSDPIITAISINALVSHYFPCILVTQLIAHILDHITMIWHFYPKCPTFENQFMVQCLARTR